MSIKQDLIDSERRAAEERSRMGAEEYNAWVKSRQAYLYSTFKSLNELEEILKKAGYDLTIIDTTNYRYIKTHFGKEDWDCFFWFWEDSYLVACYGIGDDIKLIRKFVENAENALDKKCFFNSKRERTRYFRILRKDEEITQSKASIEEVTPESVPEYTFPTIFTDTNVLKYALKNSGIVTQIQNDNFTFTLNGFNATIYKQGSSNYEFKIVGKCNLENIYEYFRKIENEYKKITQYNICENIKNKVAQNSTMQIVQEEVMEDNSIVLTISI